MGNSETHIRAATEVELEALKSQEEESMQQQQTATKLLDHQCK